MHMEAALPRILEDGTAKLSGALRVLLAQLKLELDHLQMRIDEADALIKQTAGENEACRRLVAIPGIGPVTATAVIAAIGNGAAFAKGREFAAWLGVVPREHAANKSCWESANVATPTCEHYSCKERVPSCSIG
jgi:transposase